MNVRGYYHIQTISGSISNQSRTHIRTQAHKIHIIYVRNQSNSVICVKQDLGVLCFQHTRTHIYNRPLHAHANTT